MSINSEYSYWYFKGALSEKFCDDVIARGKEEKEKLAVTGKYDKVDLDKLTSNPICVIIGPEGDFSEEERGKILAFKGVQPIKINENILRSETAVISGLSIINYVIS